MRPRLASLLAGLGACLALAAPASARSVVVGGRDATAGSFPFLASVFADAGSQQVFCGGVVIAPRLVLTAAHCVLDASSAQPRPASAFTVVTGRRRLSAGDGRTLGVSAVAVDPAFDRATLIHDAAVLVLATATDAATVRLATAGDGDLTGRTGLIAGFGLLHEGDATLADALQEATVTTEPAAVCSGADALFDATAQLCTAGAGAAAPCHGDSGGPLVLTGADGAPFLAGLVSFGIGSCGEAPSYYTSALAVGAWALAQEAQAQAPPAAAARPGGVDGTGRSAPVTAAPASAGAAATAVAPDRSAPRVRVFPARLAAGRPGRLRYRVEAGGDAVRTRLTVRDRSGRRLLRRTGWLSATAAGAPHDVAFRTGRRLRAIACVVAWDAAGNRSRSACASVVVR